MASCYPTNHQCASLGQRSNRDNSFVIQSQVCMCLFNSVQLQAGLNNTKLFIRLGVLRVYKPGHFRHSPVLGKINLHNIHGTSSFKCPRSQIHQVFFVIHLSCFYWYAEHGKSS